MDLSAIPTWFKEKWGQSAGGSYIRTVPVTTSDPAAASFDLGFPPQTFTNESAGGTPPDGRDVNGALNVITAWLQFLGAGGTGAFNSDIATAGGYPNGAVVQSRVTAGLLWISTADNNTTDPDGSSPANWTTASRATALLTSDGNIKIPVIIGGVSVTAILQWRTIAAPSFSGHTSATATWANAFPTACALAWANGLGINTGGGAIVASVTAKSTTSCTIEFDAFQNTAGPSTGAGAVVFGLGF